MKNFFLTLFFLLGSLTNNAQLYINEFMASNAETLADEAGEYNDWIEIYNASDESLDLDGYYLTDNFANPAKFSLHRLTDIPAHSYLIIFADEDGSQGNNHANFKLDREGESIAIVFILSGDTLFVDSLSYSIQVTDISYGRYPDAASNLEFFTHPTPGSANISDNLLGIAPPPLFSMPGGFFTGTQSLELSSELAGAEIRFTLDGSEPDVNDNLYTAAILLDSSVVVKAKVFAANYWPGATVAHSYFIDEHFISFDVEDRMSVVSISLDPELVWGEENGLLYATNLSNTWEYAAHIELYEPDGSQVINQVAGIKLFGNSTRRMEQKSLAVIARNVYGPNRFAYKFFNDIPFEEFKSFVLRNGGNDWSQTYFRDALCQELVRNDMDIDAQGNRQVVVYINGEFYGIMNLKEKINEHYLEAHHDIDPDNIDMLQDAATLVYGDAEEYTKFRGYVALNDMSDENLFDHLETQMDVREYMNLYIAQIFVSNIDMALNQKYWRERENSGKWRWLIYDTEMSFGQGDYSYTDQYGTIPSSNTVNFATIDYGGSGWPYLRPWSSEKFISMLDNENFRNEFIQSFATYINTSFNTGRVLRVIDSLAHRVRMEMPYQIERYGGVLVGFNPYGYHFTTMEEWEYHIDTLHNFANQRPAYLRNFIQDRFGLEGSYTLTPTMADHASGSILIQDIKVPLDAAGIYFDKVPLRVKVMPREGYRFIKWTGVEMADSTSPEVNLVLSEDVILEAVFKPELELMITEIFYNPATGAGTEFVELYNPKHSTTLDLSDYALTGDISYTFPAGSKIGPMSYLVMAADSTLIPLNIPAYQWESGALSDSDGMLKLWNDQGDLLDSINYLNVAPWPEIIANESIQLTDYTFDNAQGSHWAICPIAGGSAGIPALSDQLQYLVINEMQSFNEDFIADEYKEYNDWIEILNTGTESVDIGGMFFTNSLDTPTMCQIPTNAPLITTIAAGEYKIIWADRDTEQGPLHLNFNLNKGGSILGISADGKTFIDATPAIVVLDENISHGRYPDSDGDWRTFNSPTPGKYNSLPPEFTSIPLLAVEKRTDYAYEIQVSDPEGDELYLGIYELPQWLYFLSNENPPVLAGRSPTSNFSPQSVQLFVTDGYSKPVLHSFEIVQDIPADNLESLTMGDVSLFPNPTRDIINILTRTNSPELQLSIMNLSGQLIWTEAFVNVGGTINLQVDLSGYKKGVYILNLRTAEEVSSHKILLQ